MLREIGRLPETSAWPLIAKSRSGFVSQFGDLKGLKLASSPKRLEMTPYSVGQVQTAPVDSGDPFKSSPDPGGSVGADLKYALTPGLTMTATINPDFGQVEADPAVVNLTAFETFYQERRPFFVEGSGNFAFDLDCNDGSCTGLFYSRRIGRRRTDAERRPTADTRTAPAQTTIIGAAKLTGRAGRVLHRRPVGDHRVRARAASRPARTGGADAWSRRPRTPCFRPSANGRTSRRWASCSRTRRDASPTTCAFLPGSATTGGVSWDWRLKRPQYAVRGYWAGSLLRGEAEAIDTLQTERGPQLPAARRAPPRRTTRRARRSTARPAR